MHNVQFEGALEIRKPASMTDEECSSVWAKFGVSAEQLAHLRDTFWVDAGNDQAGYPYYVTQWQPSKEDLDALNAGRGLWLKSIGFSFQPVALLTVDADGNANT